MNMNCPACGDPRAVELNTGQDWYLCCCHCDFAAGPLPLPPEERTYLSDLLCSEIPVDEVSDLVEATASARETAALGHFALGFDGLVNRWHCAKEQVNSFPWAPELVARYRLAIDRYCLHCGVPMTAERVTAGS